MFLSSLFTKSENEISIIFDIGSASVGGALVKLSRHKIPKILYEIRRPIAFQKNTDHPAILLDSMLASLKEVALLIEKEGMTHLTFTQFKTHRIEEIFFVFSSLWHLSSTKVIKIEEDKPFVFTKELFEKVLLKEREHFEGSISNQDEEQAEHKNKLLDQKVIATKLNGYETSSPYGKEVKKAEISVYMSFIPEVVIKKTKEIGERPFHFKKSQAYSSPLIVCSVIRDIFPEEKNFFSIHISGEVTDVSVVKHGILVETFSFPLGRNFLLRHLMRISKEPLEVSLSSLKLYYEGKTDNRSRERMKQILEVSQNEWAMTFQNALNDLGENFYLPQIAYLSVEKDLDNFFAECILNNSFTHLTPKEETISITLFNFEKLKSYVHISDKKYTDSCMAYESVFLNGLFRGE